MGTICSGTHTLDLTPTPALQPKSAREETDDVRFPWRLLLLTVLANGVLELAVRPGSPLLPWATAVWVGFCAIVLWVLFAPLLRREP